MSTTQIDGQTVHTIVAAAFKILAAAFKKATGYDLLISSGYRSNAEQRALFFARYRVQASGNGAYNDVRYYEGKRWVRVSAAGTVAVPGTSLHESYRAIDIRDSGGDPGVTRAGTVRSNWIKNNAKNYGFNANGFGFGEPWHIEFAGSLAAPATVLPGGTIASIGIEHVERLQLGLGVVPDGAVGADTIRALQAKVGTVVDGDWGYNSNRALQAFIGADVDGIWGTQTATKLKAAIDAGKFGATGFLSVDLGTAYIKKLQTQLGVDADGSLGFGTISALQAKIQAVVDGDWGTNSKKALQRFLGVTDDGIIGNWTITILKAAIDANKFVTVAAPPIPKPVPEVPVITLPNGSVFGIDVAWPQTGVFDWPKVAVKNQFVFIKAAGGEDGIYGPAELLDQHLAGARSTNMRVGFYFFNNNRHSVKAQAEKFIEVLRTRIRPGDIVALDIEDVGAQPVAFNPTQAMEFADYIEEALGIKTFMYLNRAHVNGDDWSGVVAAGHPLWLATLDGLATDVKYLIEGSVKWWGKASIVQFSSTTMIDGYERGPVDQNIAMAQVLQGNEFVAFPPPPVIPEPEIPEEPEVPVEPEPEIPVDPVTPTPAPTMDWITALKIGLVGLIAFIAAWLGIDKIS